MALRLSVKPRIWNFAGIRETTGLSLYPHYKAESVGTLLATC